MEQGMSSTENRCRDTEIDDMRRRADREWEMAGLARTDKDYTDEKKHIALARMYDDKVTQMVRYS